MGAPGRLIAFEGVDGCGKSTHARRLAETLGALCTAEPGATALGSRLRALVLDPDLPSVSPRAEALLMAADRAEHVAEVVAPALEAGRWVVADRFSGSTLAYQGYGRGLDLDALGRLVAWAAAGLAPDLTVLLDVPLAVARGRMGTARADRFESLGADFHERVRAGYVDLAASDPAWVVVDGTGDEDDIAAVVLAAVTERLGSPSGAAP